MQWRGVRDANKQTTQEDGGAGFKEVDEGIAECNGYVVSKGSIWATVSKENFVEDKLAAIDASGCLLGSAKIFSDAAHVNKMLKKGVEDGTVILSGIDGSNR